MVFRRFRLTVLQGPDAGRVCVPDGDRATVGSAPGVDLVLADRTVSRVHLEISVTPEGFLLRDLGSTNGTWLEGYRVREVFLRDRAQLGVGQTLLEFGLDEREREVELSAQHRFGPLAGADPAMRRLFATLARIAPTDATVLIEGETGTGKELVAQAIHRHSKRRDGPFVVVDASSLPATLVESELFGHEKGAFTGATLAKAGAFEEADGGTVFLDELGELPVELQPKLLRVLEAREVRRVGSAHVPRRVDVRVIAATNRDLRRLINQGSFRADLYYRLAVVSVFLPPLRERPGDIPMLARMFLESLGEQAGRSLALTDETLAKLQRLPWHGNVRELRNFIERSVWLSEGGALQVTGMLERPAGPGQAPGAAASPPAAAPGAPAVAIELPYKDAKKLWTEHFDAVYLPRLIERCGGNVSRAAREAELDRAYLFRLLGRLGLRGGGAGKE
jgi:transcriptional regulator with GAF, ATPase, and Fis domain